MLGLLEVVIGIVFVLLLLSLLVTTIMELLSAVLALRGKNLEEALRNILASDDENGEILKAFRENPLYKQMSQRYGKKRRPPSYLSADAFQSILFDIILRGDKVDKLVDKLETLPDNDLKHVLKQLLHDADFELTTFRRHINTWYNDVMDRASGWYKRYVQKIILLVGILVAIIFNADTLAIYQRLESDPEALQLIVGLADDYLAKHPEAATSPTGTGLQEQVAGIQDLIKSEIDHVRSPLGLGWQNVHFIGMGPTDWAIKVLGWLVTAMAISLGAPFWFDLLKKLVNIRSSGNRPNP